MAAITDSKSSGEQTEAIRHKPVSKNSFRADP